MSGSTIVVFKHFKGLDYNRTECKNECTTAGHFAIAYKFYDLFQWLFENGGDDTVMNKDGLTAYDGLSGEGDDD